jgi:hypothetical protein
MVKMTFTLDDDVVRTIRSLAARKGKPQSLVVREAVAAYARQEEKLGHEDRARKLRLLDDLKTRPRTRPRSQVEEELREIRRARRLGWRRPGE